MTTPGHRSHDQLRSLSALLEDADEVLRRGESAGAAVWSTGFPALDQTLTGGFRAGELVLLGGSQGKREPVS